MQLSVISLIYLLGALQALILVVGINLNQPFKGQPKQILTTLLTAILVVMVYYLVIMTEYAPLYSYTDSLGTAAWMAIFPLFYLLSCSLANPSWKLQWKHLFLFPVTLLYLIEAPLTTLGFTETLYTYVGAPQLFLDLWIVAFFLPAITFTLLAMRKIKQSGTAQIKRELFGFSIAFLVVLLVFGVLYLFMRLHYEYAFELWLIGLLEVFIFTLVYRLFRMTSVSPLLHLKKYENQVATLPELDQLAKRLEQVMQEQQPYLNAKITLNELAELAQISRNDLSLLFNQHFKSNFYAFINLYRVKHVEELMTNPDYSNYKITALASMSGFNSKATFYKVFKARHGVTPAVYLKQQKQENA